MIEWAEFYERLFNFREARYFDIEGKVTAREVEGNDVRPAARSAFRSTRKGRRRPARSRNISTRITAKASSTSRWATDDIYRTVDGLRDAKIALLDTIDTYYELVDRRVPNHGESVAELKQRKILIDGVADEILLQIFTENQIGPIFFEVIQRKGNQGFGEGNFKALFESIELDQMRRGVLKDTSAT